MLQNVKYDYAASLDALTLSRSSFCSRNSKYSLSMPKQGSSFDSSEGNKKLEVD